jgi:hypothetical protein
MLAGFAFQALPKVGHRSILPPEMGSVVNPRDGAFGTIGLRVHMLWPP